MSNDFANEVLGVADYNQGFIDALEHVNQVIEERKRITQSLWRTMIPRAPFTLGQGLVRKTHIFHAGLGDQAGLHKWHPIAISSTGTDPDTDACAYNPYTVNYGFETVEYTGFGTERRTPHICIKDIKYTWQFQQQLELIFGFLGDITNSVWENYGREQYIKMATDAGRSFVLSNGSFNTHTLAYDPFSVDADDDNTVVISRDIPVSTLNWEYLKKFYQELQLACPLGATGTDEMGQPTYGLCLSVYDFDDMLKQDEKITTAFNFYSPVVNIANYGAVKTFQGYNIMSDIFAPRFAIKSMDADTVTLRRVLPFNTTAADMTIGEKPVVNNDYLNAEYGLGIIFIKDVFQIEVPPAGPSSPGGGTQFGDMPSLNGEFHWLNIQNEKTNLLNEIGFYFSRFEAFARPLANADKAITFLYKRCVNTKPSTCGINDTGTSVTSSALAADAVAVSGNTYQMKVTLSAILDAETPAAITIDSDGGGSNELTGIIADSSEAPTYVLQFATEPTVATYTESGGATVSEA